MAQDAALTTRVEEALERVRLVEEKRMFAGITVMVRGKMCVSIGRNRIMCRARMIRTAHPDFPVRPKPALHPAAAGALLNDRR